MFTIDGVIDSYYPALGKRNKFPNKHLVSFLRTSFHEAEIQQFERTYAYLDGINFIKQVLRYFDFTYKVSGLDLDCIPGHGRVLIVANEFLSRFHFYGQVLLPVQNMSGTTPRANIQEISN